MLEPAAVLSYSLQVGIVVAATGLMLALVARRAPHVRLVAWRSVLVLALALPLVALLPQRSEPSALAERAGVALAPATPSAPLRTAFEPASVDWPVWLTVGLVASAAVRLVFLLGGWVRLQAMVRHQPGERNQVFEEICQALGTDATLVWHPGVASPFTFGHRPAVVVVPAALASASAATRRAIFTHELLHVVRRDWQAVLVEEAAASLLWFHPAIWLAMRELRLAREEVVDRATVAFTGARRTYLETLIDLAGQRPERMQISPAFFSVRQLARRVAALASESPMSKSRVAVVSVVVAASGIVTAAAAVRAFPLPSVEWPSSAAPMTQARQSTPGPLEQKAFIAPRDAEPPARTHYVAPQIPGSARGLEELTLDLRLVLDAEGRVAEARLLEGTATAVNSAALEALAAALVAAARQWRYQAPAVAPLALTTTLMFVPSDAHGAVYSSRERPIPVNLVKAAYPDDARQASIEGTAEVSITIDATGQVSEARVVKAPTPSMGDAAITALKASTFRPGTKDGQPVPVMVTISIRFKLQ